ncbi:type IV pilus biogenesis/stability protein PilW [Ramlibacter sp. H39-3-26]|uniref:type IV pilus biogenesis/stability protein PilW n=1 Tax=Curvibacter soli TaxID=3031331 RepID=UPI0023DBD245|nr:type IV pilus biogenesis/stability protein PilW [Ramlibacter sp. H39-3-26]MDF1485451.1 type IV pilus biogenesis/stability protein PilW [Ramlibacter sp. H39-3-26]
MVWFPRCWECSGKWALLFLSALPCGVFLAGCAVTTQQGPAPQSQIVTPSDEPDVRRRARIRLELASSYFDHGQTSVALDEVKQSLAIDPSYGEAYNLRGLVYMRLGDFPSAEEGFKRAIALNASDADAEHNYGWLLCEQKRYSEADQFFQRALSNPTYGSRPKTLMTQGLCQMRAGLRAEAERTLSKAYELDAGNPITGYNLALLLFERQENARAQFYIRRINNSEYANAETLWLGVKVERSVGDRVAMQQLVDQLRKRFPDSKELASFDRGAFDE